MTVVAMNNFGGCSFFLPSRRCVALAVLFSPSFQGLYHPRLVCLGYLFNDLVVVRSLVGTAQGPLWGRVTGPSVGASQ